MDETSPRARLIAFHLPQFHPIPENDRWWGKGFTEWTNVTRAEPQFEAHYQPHLPADLGFYDLRLPEVRQAQAELAREHGVHGFCYWHYWFNGKRLLERPVDEIISSGQPDFPFCLAWANEHWSRRWDGFEKEVLQPQEYGGEADDRAHFENLLPAFRDRRAIRIDGRVLFLIYRPADLPSPTDSILLWRELAAKAGLGGLYLVAIRSSFQRAETSWRERGFDGELLFQPTWGALPRSQVRDPAGRAATHQITDYATAWRIWSEDAAAITADADGYTCVVPGWDNSARRKEKAFILHDSTPAEYASWLEREIGRVESRAADRRVVFLNAWNEWAEGNHLEPDQKFGRQYLEATRAVVGGRRAAPQAPLPSPSPARSAGVPDAATDPLDGDIPRVAPAPRRTPSPLWSVVIPTYEPDPALLQTAIESVLAQGVDERMQEILVIDDASSAVDVEAIVRRVGSGRVAFHRQRENQGFVGNWNAGIDRAAGAWIHLLHQDDVILKGFYEAFDRPSRERADVGAAFCRHCFLEGPKPTHVSEIERPDPGIIDGFLDRIGREQRIQFASIVVRRSAYEAVGGFDARAGGAADWEMWVRLAARFPFWYEPRVLACYRVHDASESSRLQASARNVADMGKAITLAARHLPAASRVELTTAARRHYARAAFAVSRDLMSRGRFAAAVAQIREGLRLDAAPATVAKLIETFEALPEISLKQAPLPSPAREAAAAVASNETAGPTASPPAPPPPEGKVVEEAPDRIAALASFCGRSGTTVTLQEQRQARALVVEGLYTATPDTLQAVLASPVGAALRLLATAPLRDEPLLADEAAIADALHDEWRGHGDGGGWNLLLAHLLFSPAHRRGVRFDVTRVPAFLLPDLLTLALASPATVNAEGEVVTYSAYLDGWLAEAEKQLARRAPEAAWRSVAEQLVERTTYLMPYFRADNVRDTYARRARIIERLVALAGGRTDYSFGPSRRDRLRVGFLNLHFFNQTETFSSLPTFEHLDRARFDVRLFCLRTANAPIEAYCRTRADAFTLLAGSFVEQVAALRSADLDVLVIGTNVTAVLNPVTLLAAHRLARVQLITNSCPVTSGLTNVDGYISGALIDPPDAQAHHTERVWTLEGAAHCFNYDFEAPASGPITRADLGLPPDGVVFASGANLYKIIPELQRVWAEILSRVEGSSLLLYPFTPHWSSIYPMHRLEAQLRERMAAVGVEPHRLKISKVQLPSRADIKTLVALADVYLDSYPFAGVNSTVDPLEAGLPVVAWEGGTWRSRMAASLLREIAVPELIADSERGYVDLAVGLGRDPELRRAYGERIRAAMAERPRFLDSRAYGRAFGELLERVWRAHGTQRQPSRVARSGSR